MKRAFLKFKQLSLALVCSTALICTAYAQKQEVRMLFVGYIMLDELPGKVIAKGINPFAAFHKKFKQADLSFGNLECVVGFAGKKEDKPFTFLAHPRVLKTLKSHFSAVSVANNHSGDFGPKAFETMLGLLERAKIPYFGGGRDLRSAHAPYVVEKNGHKIAILGYDNFLPRSFEALEERPGVAWADADQVAYDIRNAKENLGADIVITYPHWGWEHEPLASKHQEELARLMIDAGADAVVGGHPHVTQNIDIYKGKPIFYSLGNFVFNGFDTEESQTGWALELVFDSNKQITWTIHVAKLDKNGVPQYAGILTKQEIDKILR